MTSATPAWINLLAPDHRPPPAGYWPLAAGWWFLGLLIMALVAWLIYRGRQPYRRLSVTVRRELERLDLATRDDPTALAAGLENLLRRFAIQRYGHDRVAALTGTAWVDFVIQQGGQDWSGEAGTQLLKAAFGGATPQFREAWLAGAYAFLKRSA